MSRRLAFILGGISLAAGQAPCTTVGPPAPKATCAGFDCSPFGETLRPQPERLVCDGGCSNLVCCLAPAAPPAPAPPTTCAGFDCSPFGETLRPQPERLTYNGPCSNMVCCLAPTPCETAAITTVAPEPCTTAPPATTPKPKPTCAGFTCPADKPILRPQPER